MRQPRSGRQALPPAPGPAHETAFGVPAGSLLRLGAPPAGLRTYLAISGGLAVTPVLGSRSADMLSGLGPPPLRPGDRLPVGRPRSRPEYQPGRQPRSARLTAAASRSPVTPLPGTWPSFA